MEIRHILFKEIRFLISLNNQSNISNALSNSFCLKRKNQKEDFSFSKYA